MKLDKIEIVPPRDPAKSTHIISLGAGVQSTVLYLLAAKGDITPMPTAAVFADTLWEPPHVYEHLDWLESLETDIPIYRVSAGDLYDDVWHARHANRKDTTVFTTIPTFGMNKQGVMAISRRQCTPEYKVRPIQAKCSEIIGRKRGARQPYCAQWLGITTDEWMRMKPARPGWQDNIWPLIEMGWNRNDCQKWFSANFPGRNLAKSSCVGCPFHSDRTWLELARRCPEQMERTIELDEHLRTPERVALGKWDDAGRYLHRSGKPLRDVLADLDRKDREQLTLFDVDDFGEECEGHCGI